MSMFFPASKVLNICRNSIKVQLLKKNINPRIVSLVSRHRYGEINKVKMYNELILSAFRIAVPVDTRGVPWCVVGAVPSGAKGDKPRRKTTP